MKAIFIVVLFLSDDARCEGLSELFPRVRGTEIRGLQGMPLASKDTGPDLLHRETGANMRSSCAWRQDENMDGLSPTTMMHGQSHICPPLHSCSKTPHALHT